MTRPQEIVLGNYLIEYWQVFCVHGVCALLCVKELGNKYFSNLFLRINSGREFTIINGFFSSHGQDDLTMTLVQQCHQSQFIVQRIIETAGENEALLFEALNVNDEIQKVLSKYEELQRPSIVPPEPEPAMIPVAIEPDESPRCAKEDSLIRKPAGSRGGNNDEMMDDLDEMIFGKKVGGTSQGGHDAKKQPSPKDDLIKF